MLPRPPTCTLFPYTTLFRSLPEAAGQLHLGGLVQGGVEDLRPLQGAQPVVDARIDVDHLAVAVEQVDGGQEADRKSTRLNSSHVRISYAVFCLKKKKQEINQ